MNNLYNLISGRSVERLAALSDGVFAIAMTLIVLDIHVPDIANVHSESDLLNALWSLLPRLLTYFLSFLTLGIFWVGQQTLLSQIEHSDRNFTWLQFAFLMDVSLTPFSTGLLSDFIEYRVALIVYWLFIVLLGAALFASRRYARHAGLVKSDVSDEMWTVSQKRILQAQSLYAIGALLCVFSTYISIGFIVLVQLNYGVLPWISAIFERTPRKV